MFLSWVNSICRREDTRPQIDEEEEQEDEEEEEEPEEEDAATDDIKAETRLKDHEQSENTVDGAGKQPVNVAILDSSTFQLASLADDRKLREARNCHTTTDPSERPNLQTEPLPNGDGGDGGCRDWKWNDCRQWKTKDWRREKDSKRKDCGQWKGSWWEGCGQWKDSKWKDSRA